MRNFTGKEQGKKRKKTPRMRILSTFLPLVKTRKTALLNDVGY